MGIRFVVFLSIIALIQWRSSALTVPVPQPKHGSLYLCYTKECFDRALALTLKQNGTLVTIVTNSFRHDPYLVLYLGWILHLLGDDEPTRPEHPPHVLLMEPSVFLGPEAPESSEISTDGSVINNSNIDSNRRIILSNILLLHQANLSLSNFPLPWIYVSIEHGSSSFGMKSLHQVQAVNPHLEFNMPRVILHLNHEQPWFVEDKESLDFIFDSVGELRQAYAAFPLVLRNYYYEPLMKKTNNTDTETLFVPLGPSYYGYLVGNASTSLSENKAAAITPASKRRGLCYFAGRGKYQAKETQSMQSAPQKQQEQQYTKNNHNTTTEEEEDKKEAEQRHVPVLSHVQQRAEFLALMDHKQRRKRQVKEHTKSDTDIDTSNGFGACEILVDSAHGALYDIDQYTTYLHALSNTVFALCPPGNNPETFRIYEALERGAIPILVQAEAEKDFAGTSLWGGRGIRGKQNTRHVRDAATLENNMDVDLDIDANIDVQGKGDEHGDEDNRSENGSDVRSSAYPGPIFDSWEQADAFLARMQPPVLQDYTFSSSSASAFQDYEMARITRAVIIDEMQRELQEWYTAMKRRSVRQIQKAMKKAFDPNRVMQDTLKKLSTAKKALYEAETEIEKLKAQLRNEKERK